jgi:hypothetical protein
MSADMSAEFVDLTQTFFDLRLTTHGVDVLHRERRVPRGSKLESGRWEIEIPADPAGEVIVYFPVPRYGRDLACCSIDVDSVGAALAE